MLMLTHHRGGPWTRRPTAKTPSSDRRHDGAAPRTRLSPSHAGRESIVHVMDMLSALVAIACAVRLCLHGSHGKGDPQWSDLSIALQRLPRVLNNAADTIKQTVNVTLRCQFKQRHPLAKPCVLSAFRSHPPNSPAMRKNC